MKPSIMLRALGVAYILVAVLLLPANLFLGFLSIMIVLPLQIWLFSLGIRLWRPDVRLQAALRISRLVLGPFALLLIAYGVYALRTATHGGAGTFGRVPIMLGACSVFLALWSGSVAKYLRLELPEGSGRSADFGTHSDKGGGPAQQLPSTKNLSEYVDVFVVKVSNGNMDVYRDHARATATALKEYGALNVVQCWSGDVSDDGIYPFPLEEKCRSDEALVCSWISWPSQDARNIGMKKVMGDSKLSPQRNPLSFAQQRLICSGLRMLVEE